VHPIVLILFAQVDAFNPGGVSSPPGTGCQIGTSGCFPSAPAGPVTQPTDPGATSEAPPPSVNPADVPFFGSLPGVTNPPDETVLSPDESQRAQKAAEEQKQADDRAVQEERNQQLQKMIEQQQQIIDQQREQIEQQDEQQQQQQEQQEQQQEQQPPAPSPSP
jgi:hypothetical protein